MKIHYFQRYHEKENVATVIPLSPIDGAECQLYLYNIIFYPWSKFIC